MMITSLNRLNLDIKKPYQICLLFIAVLAIYYPSLSAEISVLDDREALFSLFNLQSFDLKTIFIPKVQGGGYYRPFISVSYMIDRFWWDLSLQTMHLENILLHLANVLMVFWLGVKLCTSSANGRGLLPFSGALVFALHPINTESISWISGRTDPMACFFVLSAFLLLITYRKNKKVLLLGAALFVAMLGVLAKETALAFIPAAFFVLIASDDNLEKFTNASYWESSRKTRVIFAIYSFIAILLALLSLNYYLVLVTGAVFALQLYLQESYDVTKQKLFGSLKLILCLVSLFILLLLLFYGLRKVAFESDMPKIPNIINVMTSDINYTIELFLGAAGFYVKKFFLPLPLNLAIREIDPLYELFGVLCLMACIYLIMVRRISSSLILAGFIMLLPVFPLAFGTIAWTAYAERYLYIPSALWILGGITFLDASSQRLKISTVRYGMLVWALVVVVFTGITFQRNMLWRTNIGLFRDTVQKSPDFKNVRGLYMSALVDRGEYAEAEKQYLIASRMKSVAYDERYDLLYATILKNMNKFDQAEKVYKDTELKTKGESAALYEALMAYCDSRLFNLKDENVRNKLMQKKLYALERLYALKKSPFIAYRMGQIYLTLGSFEKAHAAVECSVTTFASDDPLKKSAEMLLKTIDDK